MNSLIKDSSSIITILICIITFNIIGSSYARQVDDKNNKDTQQEQYKDFSIKINKSESLHSINYNGKRSFYKRLKLKDLTGNGTLTSGAIVDAIVKNKIKATVDDVRFKKNTRDKAIKMRKEYRKILSSEQYNKSRAEYLKSKKGITGANSDKVILKYKQANKEVIQRTREHVAATAKAKADVDIIHQRKSMYNKVTGVIGAGGKILTVISSAQQSYYTDPETGKVYFSYGAFAKNAAMNLTGVSGFVSAYSMGYEAKEKEYNRILDKYLKEGKDITDPAIIYKAMLRATGTGLIVGAYEGSKCVPLVGDALTVYELSESSIGLVYDTFKSEQIRIDNAKEIERQAGSSIKGLKHLANKIKRYKVAFDKAKFQADEAYYKYQKQRKIYDKLWSNFVKRDTNNNIVMDLQSSIGKVTPFLQKSYITSIDEKTKQISNAINVSFKLAQTASDNNNAEALTKTKKELSDMLRSLKIYRDECDSAIETLSPYSKANKIFKSIQDNNQISKESIEYTDIIECSQMLIRLHNKQSMLCNKLRESQRKTYEIFDRAAEYFSIHNHNDTLYKKITSMRQECILLSINDYDTNTLNKRTKQLINDYNHWRPIKFNVTKTNPLLAKLTSKSEKTISEINTTKSQLDKLIQQTQKRLNLLHLVDSKAIDELEHQEKKENKSDTEKRVAIKRLVNENSDLQEMKTMSIKDPLMKELAANYSYYLKRTGRVGQDALVEMKLYKKIQGGYSITFSIKEPNKSEYPLTSLLSEMQVRMLLNQIKSFRERDKKNHFYFHE